MDLGLRDRVALVTGAARGIGRAEAELLAQEGAVIAVNDLDAAAAREAAAALRDAGHRAEAFPGDAADPQAVPEMVARIADRFGRLDILVNNAGAGGRHLGRHAEDMALDDWNAIVDSHLRGTFLCTQAAIGPMKAGGFGRIVNTSSMNFTGGGRPGVSNYAAAKAGILGFTRTVAKEIGPAGVTVNAIAPGYVETDLIAGFSEQQRQVIATQNPLGRFCRPQEVAATVAFLCSNQAAFINGALICIDGGKRDFHWG